MRFGKSRPPTRPHWGTPASAWRSPTQTPSSGLACSDSAPASRLQRRQLTLAISRAFNNSRSTKISPLRARRASRSLASRAALAFPAKHSSCHGSHHKFRCRPPTVESGCRRRLAAPRRNADTRRPKLACERGRLHRDLLHGTCPCLPAGDRGHRGSIESALASLQPVRDPDHRRQAPPPRGVRGQPKCGHRTGGGSWQRLIRFISLLGNDVLQGPVPPVEGTRNLQIGTH
jgi:hypothetical protein